MTGSFNCSNTMAAVACALALGVDADTIVSALARFEGVPGRFERIDEGQPFELIVDYAHTPAGLKTVLDTARELTDRKLICLFGCGGDRDRGKRPHMGRIAGELADEVFLTSDNPRSEPPERIIEDIAAGMSARVKAHLFPDRREAIGRALQTAGDGDVVVLAGKGNETRQEFSDHAIEFDDRHVAREWLRGRGDCRRRALSGRGHWRRDTPMDRRAMGWRGSGRDFSEGISTDTRSLKEGEAFLALRGPNYDGNRFVEEAFDRGACAAIADSCEGTGLQPVLRVADTLKALGEIAKQYRRRFELPVIAITGSSGKTTTKEMTAAVLGRTMRVLKTPESQNNEVGCR